MLRGDKTRSLVADGEDCHQVWRIAVNMLNKKSRTAEKEQSSSWETGRRLTPSINKYVLQMSHSTSDLDVCVGRRMKIKFVSYLGVNGSHLAVDSVKWRGLVYTEVNYLIAAVVTTLRASAEPVKTALNSQCSKASNAVVLNYSGGSPSTMTLKHAIWSP
jgi:hypothetical protein